MRYTTTLILALAVIAATFVIYMYWDQLRGTAKPPEKAPEGSLLVAKVPVDDITGVVLQERAAGVPSRPRRPSSGPRASGG